MHMLRDIEKQTITQGMYVRFILSTKEDPVPAIIMLSSTDNVYHTERTDDGRLLFVFFTTLTSGDNHFQHILDLQNDIASLFSSDKDYTLDFVTSNSGEYKFHVFGHIGEGQVVNLFLPDELLKNYDDAPEELSEDDKALVAAYHAVYHNVVEEI